jgi:hypothetical protein
MIMDIQRLNVTVVKIFAKAGRWSTVSLFARAVENLYSGSTPSAAET